MTDGLNIEYTEGVVTVKLEIRSNCIGDFEKRLFESFQQMCREIFNHKVEIAESSGVTIEDFSKESNE